MKLSVLILLFNYINLSYALINLKTDWEPFSTKIIIPDIIDLTNGGNINMEINQGYHNWSNSVYGKTYGYGLLNKKITYPGPTILVSKNIPISITWHNKLLHPHILSNNIELSLLVNQSSCYPSCGIPSTIHIHGLEAPANNDGLFTHTIYSNKSQTSIYKNTQGASTKVYHDHSLGLSRLNVWAGLIGLYIISDKQFDKKYNLDIKQDIPLIFQDKLISQDGSILYSDDICPDTPNSKWVPESFGNVNLVNGIVMPYLEIESTTVRFRLVNAANARHYTMNIPFYNKCKLIASDSGYVQHIENLNQEIVLFPLERLEIICDFSNLENKEYIITDTNSGEFEPYNENIMKIKIISNKHKYNNNYNKIPSTLNSFKNLKSLWKLNNRIEKNITLGELKGQSCPIKSLLSQNNTMMSMDNIKHTLTCKKGTIEKWNFKNPTDDAHPFHWHLVNAQCGNDDNSINENLLKDTVQIPNDPNNDPNVITQICYVACTPERFLYTNSYTKSTDFGFNTNEPYVAHCHILEHEENSMMSWFKIIE